jgi:hypothetical protein
MANANNNFGEIIFGSGTGILTPYATNGPANPTPLQLPVLQELSIDFSADMAELYGQDQFAYALARTKTKIDCKAKVGAIYAALLSDLFFGATLSNASQTLFQLQEINTVTSHACTVANGAHFIADCGVINGTTGIPYRAVAATPAVGQYTVNSTTGAYAFNTADTISVANITYTYSAATQGQSATISNKPMGAMPTFDFKYMNNQFGPNLFLEFFLAISKKISLPNKNTEFDMVDFDFSCFSQQTGNVFTLSMDE